MQLPNGVDIHKVLDECMEKTSGDILLIGSDRNILESISGKKVVILETNHQNFVNMSKEFPQYKWIFGSDYVEMCLPLQFIHWGIIVINCPDIKVIISEIIPWMYSYCEYLIVANKYDNDILSLDSLFECRSENNEICVLSIPRPQRHKLLVCIAFHHNPSYIQYLKEAVSEFIDEYSRYVDVDIIIDTNCQEGADIVDALFGESVRICIHDTLPHPFHLTWMHRRHIRDSLDMYDVFMYIECDMLFPYENYRNYLENWELIWPMGVPVLYRIEEKDGVYYNSDAEQRERIPRSQVVCINNREFVHRLRHPLPYHAMWICPQKILKEIIPDDFVKQTISRETAASFLIWEMRKEGYMQMENGCVSTKAYVYHLPSNYARSNGRLGQIKADDAIQIVEGT